MTSTVEIRPLAVSIVGLEEDHQATGRSLGYGPQISDGLPSLSSSSAPDTFSLSCECCARCEQSRQIAARCLSRTNQCLSRADLDRYQRCQDRLHNHIVLNKISKGKWLLRSRFLPCGPPTIISQTISVCHTRVLVKHSTGVDPQACSL